MLAVIVAAQVQLVRGAHVVVTGDRPDQHSLGERVQVDRPPQPGDGVNEPRRRGVDLAQLGVLAARDPQPALPAGAEHQVLAFEVGTHDDVVHGHAPIVRGSKNGGGCVPLVGGAGRASARGGFGTCRARRSTAIKGVTHQSAASCWSIRAGPAGPHSSRHASSRSRWRASRSRHAWHICSGLRWVTRSRDSRAAMNPSA